MATHSSILAWKIPWTEEPGGLRPMGSQRADTPEATEQACSHGAFVELYLGVQGCVSCYTLGFTRSDFRKKPQGKSMWMQAVTHEPVSTEHLRWGGSSGKEAAC